MVEVVLRRIDIGLDQGGWARCDPEAHAIFSERATRLRGKAQEF